MSTKSTILLTSENEHIYFDCSNRFETADETEAQEINFEFSKKNITLFEDDEDLLFCLDKDSEAYRFFSKIFRKEVYSEKKENVNTELLKALKVALQYIEITDGYEEVEIDGEMTDRYDIIDVVESAVKSVEINETVGKP